MQPRSRAQLAERVGDARGGPPRRRFAHGGHRALPTGHARRARQRRQRLVALVAYAQGEARFPGPVRQLEQQGVVPGAQLDGERGLVPARRMHGGVLVHELPVHPQAGRAARSQVQRGGPRARRANYRSRVHGRVLRRPHRRGQVHVPERERLLRQRSPGDVVVLAGMLRGWVVARRLGRVDGAQPGAAVIFERADHRPGADRSGAVHDGARLQELPLRDRELRPQLERRGADVGAGAAI